VRFITLGVRIGSMSLGLGAVAKKNAVGSGVVELRLWD
jgi:hypothetical protein